MPVDQVQALGRGEVLGGPGEAAVGEQDDDVALVYGASVPFRTCRSGVPMTAPARPERRCLHWVTQRRPKGPVALTSAPLSPTPPTADQDDVAAAVAKHQIPYRVLKLAVMQLVLTRHRIPQGPCLSLLWPLLLPTEQESEEDSGSCRQQTKRANPRVGGQPVHQPGYQPHDDNDSDEYFAARIGLLALP
ncbi:hypothetical protein [Streptomyces sp. NPDC048438]|uniref:hypothetical protein n=1 Tax=Streptomyces sp. NPDC048438 TaxID=3365551 RepID=UPI00371BAB6F